jgi:hypothetical protein
VVNKKKGTIMKIDKIAVKTKVVKWSVLDGKELLDFDVLDLSPDQVGKIERIIREKDNSVNITIEPEQKKLQLAGIISAVRLVSLICREKGQRLKIAEFKSPDERATDMKKIISAETPVILTIEIKQNKLFDEQKKDINQKPEDDFDPASEQSAEKAAAAEDAVFEKPKRGRKKKIKNSYLGI